MWTTMATCKEASRQCTRRQKSIRLLILHRWRTTGLRSSAHPFGRRGQSWRKSSNGFFRIAAASIDELIVVTGGWLPHMTRAALTGSRKRGFVTAIERSDKERGSIYRVERSPNAEDSTATHSNVAQAAVESLSKKMRREAKPKARRAA
jgi:hypothetical protein